ncbi:hypothetical protein RCL1_003220 [Eukaryota sp. TZLM3-RCL]
MVTEQVAKHNSHRSTLFLLVAVATFLIVFLTINVNGQLRLLDATHQRLKEFGPVYTFPSSSNPNRDVSSLVKSRVSGLLIDFDLSFTVVPFDGDASSFCSTGESVPDIAFEIVLSSYWINAKRCYVVSVEFSELPSSVYLEVLE